MNGLARYASRYLEIMYEMPAAAPEVWTGLCQLFDYYLCAVFHGFVSPDDRLRFTTKNSKKSSILAASQSKHFEALQTFLDRAMNEQVQTGQMMRDEGGGGGGITSSLKSSSFDSMNGPGPGSGPGGERSQYHHHHHQSQPTTALVPEVVKMSSLLQPPSSSLVDFNDAKNLYALTERVMAAESCLFAVNVLNEVKDMILKLLASDDQQACSNYISQYHIVAVQLRNLVYKSMCPLLIKQPQVVQHLVENTSWDSYQFQRKKVDGDDHHEWVDILVNACSDVWAYLSEQKGGDEVLESVREKLWLEVCQSAFDAALDGFCKLRKCSLEGRAAMTIDVTALHEGLNSIHPFATTALSPTRGKAHIDNLIKASYMAEDDMMEWVAENWQTYSYKQLHGLLTQTLSSVLNSKKLKDAVAVIDAYYECENIHEGGRLSSLLKINREEAGSKISSVLSSIRSKSHLPFSG